MKNYKKIHLTFLSFMVILGLLNAADNITVGSRITIKASEIQISDGEFLDKFTSKIKAYAKPINNSSDTIPLKVLTQPSDSSQLEEVKLYLQKKVLLMSKKLIKTAYKAGKSASTIEEGKAVELECHIIYNDKDYTIPRIFNLMPPKIEDITDMKGVHLENMPTPSQNIKVIGDFFGSKKPKVWLEYLNSKKNKIKPLKCKVIKPFEYKNSKGVMGKSCMDIDSGESSISIVLPKKFPLGWNPENANIVLQNKSAFTTISLPVDINQYYSIMGKITGVNGISGVLLKCQNTDPNFLESTTTDETGAYKFENLSPDTYIITPELANFTYIPASQTVTLDNSNILDVNFISQENSSTVYLLTVNNGTGSGQYAENDLVNISATVPAGKIFKEWAGDIQYIADTTAASTTITMPPQNITVTAIFDDAPANTYSLSGTVSGDIQQGVTVSVDATHSAVTDASGNYTISGLADGAYTVTPTLAGYTFTPATANAAISGADVTGLDFTAASSGGITYSISGTVLGDIQQGVTVSVDATHSAVTDVSGNYTISGLADGAYTVTPTLAGYTFTPATANAAISGADVTGLDFTAASSGGGTQYTLTVNDGTGSGQYAENDSVNITATVPAGKIFKEWTGDTQYLADTTAASTTVTMPAQNITVTATFDDAQGNTYSLSGTVSGDIQQGVTVSVDATHSATTDASGNYTISGLADGAYTVTPTLAGYTFTPATASATVSGADVTGVDFTSATTGTGTDVPTSIAGCVLWLDGADPAGDGTAFTGALQSWQDKSGKNNNAEQSDTNMQPNVLAGELNGHSVLSFDGVDDSLNFTEITDIKTVFWVLKEQNQTSDGSNLHFLLGNNNKYDFHRGTGTLWDSTYAADGIKNGKTRVDRADFDGLTADIPADQYVIVSLVASADLIASQITKDRDIGRFWDGGIAEIIIYNQALSDADRDTVENYLYNKWFGGTAPTTYSISGTVSGDVQQGVAVAVDATHSATTDANGNYTISGLADGTYTVTPTLAGYTFTPATASATVSGADVTGIDFTAASSGGGTQYTLTVNDGTGSGQYAENDSVNISATVPAGQVFDAWTGDTQYLADATAASTTVTMPAQNITVTATFKGGQPNTYSISGTVSGDVQQGVAVAVDATHSATTDANGNYTISGLVDGTYTVTPTLAGYTFTPATASATVSGADVTGVDFTAASSGGGTQYTLTVNDGTGSGQYSENDSVNITATVPAGKIFKEWTGDTQYLADTTAASTTVTMPAQDITVTATFDDATYTLSGTVSGDIQQGVTVAVDATHSAVTDASGNYTINGLVDGSYTVTPTLKGYTFTPATASATVSGADVTGVDFNATKKISPELVIDPNSKYRIENQFNGLSLQGSGSFLCEPRTVDRVPFIFEPVGDKTYRLKSFDKDVYLKTGDNAGDLVTTVPSSTTDDTVWEVKKYVFPNGRDLGIYTIKNVQTGLFLCTKIDMTADNLHQTDTEKLIVDVDNPGSRTHLWMIELFVKDSLEVLTGSQGGWTPNTINKCALLSSDTSLGDSVPFSIDVNGKTINGNALLWGQYWHDQYFYILNLNIPELETVGDYKLTANGKETTIHIIEEAYSHPLRSYGNDRFTLKDLLDDTWGFIGHWAHLAHWYPNGLYTFPALTGEWVWKDYDDLAIPNGKYDEPFDPSQPYTTEEAENALKGTWDMTDRCWHSYMSDGVVLEQLASFYKMTEDEDLKKMIVREIEYGVNGMILNQEQNGSWRNRSYVKTYWTGTAASMGAGLMNVYPILLERNSSFAPQTLTAVNKAWAYVYGNRNDPTTWAINGEGVLMDGHTVLASYPAKHRNGYTKDFLRFAVARYIVNKDNESKDFIDDILSRGGINSSGRLYHVSGAKFPGEQGRTRSDYAIVALLKYYKYATPDQQEKILQMSREYYKSQILRYNDFRGPVGMIEGFIYNNGTGAQWEIPEYMLISTLLYKQFGDEFGRGLIIAQRIIDYWYGCNAFATSLVFGVGDRHLLYGWRSYEALGRHVGASAGSHSFDLLCLETRWAGTETSSPGNTMLWEGINTFEKVLPFVTSVKCYTQENLTGTYSVYLTGKYYTKHIKSYGVRPEDILSIDIPDGFSIKVFDQDSLKGNSETFTSSQNNLQSWAGKIKSFSIEVSRPNVRIISPEKNIIISAGTAISLQGYATDPQDNILSGTQLVWMNGQTQLGTGESLSGVVLPVGENVIELKATDNDNNTVVAKITVTVN